jgi:TM2 domain-containing membrane protein YozV
MTDTPDLALYEGGRKSLGLAYGLWFFLGLFGAHRFYTRAGKTGWIMLALHVGGWVLLAIAFYTHSETTTQSYETAFGVGSMTEVTMNGGGGILAVLGQAMRGAAWVWWLIDIFLVPGLVRRWNLRLASGLGLRAG